MIHSNSNDLHISGMGKATGGTYNNVQIDGMTTVNGDIECQTFISNGKSTVNGNINANSLSIKGLSKIEGNIQATKMQIDGSVKLDGNLKGEQINLNGMVNIDGDCEAEEFLADGGFTIDGLLNAGHINIKLRGKCRIEEIGGENIVVTKEKSGTSFNIIGSIFPIHLITDSIEGNKIQLEFTKAEIVRGNEIIIGPGCEIETVEYKSSLYIDDTAKVETHRQI